MTLIRLVLTIILAAVLMQQAALAQPAPAASAPVQLTEADITFDTACGAPGIGRQYVAANGRAKGEIHPREAQPGKRVGPRPHGYWSVCTMPPAPRDCPARPAPGWTGKGGYYCQSVQGRMIPSRNAPFGHDVGSAPGLRNKGISHWRCERWPNGVIEWREVRSSCEPRQ